MRLIIYDLTSILMIFNSKIEWDLPSKHYSQITRISYELHPYLATLYVKKPAKNWYSLEPKKSNSMLEELIE